MGTPAGQPLKVLMLASSYPRSAGDSASVFMRNLAEHLYKRGHAVHVLAPADKEAGSRVENGIVVHRFRYLPKPWQRLAYGSGILPNLRRNPLLWIQVPFFLAGMTIALVRLTRALRPQVIHAHWVIPQGLIAVLVRRLIRTPVIVTLHGGDAFAFKGGLLTWLKQRALKHASAWTANTDATAAALRLADGAPAPEIIPMGVEVDRFANGRRATHRSTSPDKEFVVLFVGRLVEKKGVDDLITAFSMLPLTLSRNTRLWIVGGGDEEASLRIHAEKLGVFERIRFWGAIPNSELPDIYAAADIFVGPSVVAGSGDTEGQGVVFLEAFASGTCVLATRTGGIVDVVEDGVTGILAPPRNPSQLAAAMEALLTNQELRNTLTKNAYHKVMETYAWEKIAHRFEALYGSILSSSNNK